ncbi:VOC family protein [Sciscionella marina]|uniref:VOC family protein n=1 Tax=Sciscionella marina TaxID=508770 RepID=UPI0003751AEE|nr:VOC family protein [Sciscionella marina]
MALIDSSDIAHIRLTVTDIDRSKAFYDQVFGWPAAIDMSARADEPGVRASREAFYGGVVYQLPSGTLLGLRPVAPSGQRFDSEHTGLDHLSFQVASKDELQVTRQRLDQAGVPHGEVTDLADVGLAILSFSDPDGVHLELTAPLQG